MALAGLLTAVLCNKSEITKQRENQMGEGIKMHSLIPCNGTINTTPILDPDRSSPMQPRIINVNPITQIEPGFVGGIKL